MKRAELLFAGMVAAAIVAVSDATAHADIVHSPGVRNFVSAFAATPSASP